MTILGGTWPNKKLKNYKKKYIWIVYGSCLGNSVEVCSYFSSFFGMNRLKFLFQKHQAHQLAEEWMYFQCPCPVNSLSCIFIDSHKASFYLHMLWHLTKGASMNQNTHSFSSHRQCFSVLVLGTTYQHFYVTLIGLPKDTWLTTRISNPICVEKSLWQSDLTFSYSQDKNFW